jgi:hypothetical protein
MAAYADLAPGPDGVRLKHTDGVATTQHGRQIVRLVHAIEEDRQIGLAALETRTQALEPTFAHNAIIGPFRKPQAYASPRATMN